MDVSRLRPQRARCMPQYYCYYHYYYTLSSSNMCSQHNTRDCPPVRVSSKRARGGLVARAVSRGHTHHTHTARGASERLAYVTCLVGSARSPPAGAPDVHDVGTTGRAHALSLPRPHPRGGVGCRVSGSLTRARPPRAARRTRGATSCRRRWGAAHRRRAGGCRARWSPPCRAAGRRVG